MEPGLNSAFPGKKEFKVLFLVISAAAFLVVALRSWLVPFNHDETASFFFFIQSGNYMPFYTDADANNHVLNSMLANFCFHLFGSSPFALRLPNTLAFLLLIYATYKIAQTLQTGGSKIFLAAGLLISFNWISFYSACRGYGLSLALFTTGLAFLLDYFKTQSARTFALTILFFQLAISSNLIFNVIVLLISGILIINQGLNKNLFKPSVLAVWLIHSGLSYYWVKYSLWLQENGALYYGAGDSYWQITFRTLFQVITGSWSEILAYAIVAAFIALTAITLYVNRDNLKLFAQLKSPSPSLFFLAVLLALLLGFYLMHTLMGVNYPEDRTGLFFYLFFILLAAYSFDGLRARVNTAFLSLVSVLIAVHFFFNLNFRKHQLYVYETIPPHFYETLLKEQKKSPERITIGGHRVRELFFDFMNYRHGGVLNPVTFTETMQMNTDYCLGTAVEEKYYKDYYEVIDAEPDWGFNVLKRKKKLNRILLAETKDKLLETPGAEFLEAYSATDSLRRKPLQAEFNFTIEEIPVPANVWIVMQINDSVGNAQVYRRYPLQWSGYNLNGKTFTYDLTSGNLSLLTKKIVCYFWNTKKQPLRVRLHSLKLYMLDGEGVEYVAPDVR